jgi:hypothetical protein
MLVRYLPPAAPTIPSAPLQGEQWLHEVKIDSWRIQLHKHGRSAAAFTKNGHAHSSRVRWMADALTRLPGVIIDGELVACDGAGVPQFYALQFHSRDLERYLQRIRLKSEEREREGECEPVTRTARDLVSGRFLSSQERERRRSGLLRLGLGNQASVLLDPGSAQSG